MHFILPQGKSESSKNKIITWDLIVRITKKLEDLELGAYLCELSMLYF